MYPQKSRDSTSAIKDGLLGFGNAVTDSVPNPKLLTFLKFITVKDCARPTLTGKYSPSSCRKIPSVKDGVNSTQRIPFASLLKYPPLDPGEFVESYI